MNVNVSKVSNEEEILLWYEKFPDFVKFLKLIIVNSGHFEILYENNKSCLFESKLKYKSFWDGKWYDYSFIDIEIGDTHQQRFHEKFHENRISYEEYSVKISLKKFYSLKKVKQKTFFSSIEKIEKKSESTYFYLLHIKPIEILDIFRIGTTYTYGGLKGRFIDHDINWFIDRYQNENYVFDINFDLFNFSKDLQNEIYNFYLEFIVKENLRRKEKLVVDKNSYLLELDKDGNGEVDLVDGESFNKLLTKNQKSVIEIDKNYIQKFVKISMYLKTKKSNTQKIFDSIKDTKNDTELNELVNLLKNQIHTYELLVFHSISMITSLVESDLITFYEIYECFDQLGVFNSNWENEVSDKLTDIGDGIRDLMYSIYQMENKIVNSIDNLTYVTQDSFRELNRSVNNQLSSIDSSIKFNNLLTGIQTYQMYKINQNTKRIG
jgi:hypothetical protein